MSKNKKTKHIKSDGTITVKGTDGKIVDNVAGAAINGPTVVPSPGSTSHKARRQAEREAKAKRREAKARKSARDRALCPADVSKILGLKVANVAAAMREAGVSEPISTATARAWNNGELEKPEWLDGLYAYAYFAQGCQEVVWERKRAQEEAEKKQAELRVDNWLAGIGDGKFRRGSYEELLIVDMQFRILKGVGFDESHPDLDDADRRILAWSATRR